MSNLVTEKAEMRALNNRFANYIETVHLLQQENQQLAVKLDLTGHQPERNTNIYEEEMKTLRGKVETLTNEKAEIEQKKCRLEEELKQVKFKLDDQACKIEEAEEEVQNCREEVDTAKLEKTQQETCVLKLQGEINFLKKVHEEEVSRLRAQIKDAVGTVQVDKSRPDLSSTLRDLRGQLEAIAAKNTNQAIERFKLKVSDLKQKLENKTEALRMATQQSTEYLIKNQTYTHEINMLKETIKSLTKEKEEVVRSQHETIRTLQVEQATMIEQTTQEQHKYQELLNIKTSLDAEIATYRNLLEGEESRISNPADPHNSTPTPSWLGKAPSPLFISSGPLHSEDDEDFPFDHILPADDF